MSLALREAIARLLGGFDGRQQEQQITGPSDPQVRS